MADLWRTIGDRVPVSWMRVLVNLWPPYLGAGVKVLQLSPDFRYIKVSLKRRWYNSNYVGTQFGGSIYSMTDPFYMLMLINNLGPDYIVWDKAAQVRFRKPGVGALFAEFKIHDSDLSQIREQLKTTSKIDWTRTVLVTDREGKLIAEVEKVVHIRKKESLAIKDGSC